MERTQKYYENIDILRGFAILLVVLGHALAPENIGTSDVEWCNGMYDFIYTFHMPLFFKFQDFVTFIVKVTENLSYIRANSYYFHMWYLILSLL